MALNPHELLDKWIIEGHQVIAAPRGVDHFGIPYAQLYGDCVRVPNIKKVIFNDPATIVIWSDGTKTVVKCGENDIFDPEKGLAMAIAKKALGNKGNYFNEIKKWTEPWYEEQEKKLAEEEGNSVANALKRISEQAIQVGKAINNYDVLIKDPVLKKTCGTCKYGATAFFTGPCVSCAMDRHTLDPSHWEPKDTCQ
jgi:hypothetical protein